MLHDETNVDDSVTLELIPNAENDVVYNYCGQCFYRFVDRCLKHGVRVHVNNHACENFEKEEIE